MSEAWFTRAYKRSDWDLLLDDIVHGGFNSLVLGIKWLTTGYRSRLPWIYQDPSCTAINTNNELIYYALKGARQRGISIWLLIVATIYPKFCDGEAEYRIPIYNEWARHNNRPDYITIKNVRLEPRPYPFLHWRDFTTWRRIETLKRIEQVVREDGFTGKLATIVELDNQPTVVMGNVNLEMIHLALPDWPVVTYDSIYDRRRNRLATADFRIQQPRNIGLETYYLTRGVMTFGIPSDLTATNLEYNGACR